MPKRVRCGDYYALVIRGPRKDDRFYWQAQVSVGHGKRETQALGWYTRPEVTKRLAALVAEGGLNMKPRPDSDGMVTVRDLFESYLFARERDTALSKLTVRNNRTAMRRIETELGDVVLRRVDLEVLERYRDKARTSSMSNTVRFDLRVFRQAWRWALERGLLTEPWPRVRVLDQGDRRPSPTPELEAIDKVERALRKAWPEGWPWRFFHLQAVTGARTGEIARLELGDVDLERATLRIRGKHTPGKEAVRTVPLLKDTVATLRAWAKVRATQMSGAERPSPWLWGLLPTSAENALRQDHLPEALKKAKVAPFTPYGLRRAAADRMLRAGVGVEVAAAWLGHSPKQMLETYRRATPDELRRAGELARVGRAPRGTVIHIAEEEGK